MDSSIVITGTPGTGKHTIANRIANMLELPLIDINKVAQNSGFLDDIDTSKLKVIIADMLSSPSVIVGHLAPYCISYEQIKTIIVLRRNPYELLSIYESRGYTKSKSMENAASEILDIIFHDAKSKFNEKTVQIKSTDINSTISKVLDAIYKNKDEKVDWLDMVSKNGDFEKFFSY